MVMSRFRFAICTLVFRAGAVALAIITVWLPPRALGEAVPVAPSRDARRMGLTYRASVYFQQRDWAKAARAYKHITKRNPGSASAWFRLGYARHALGEYEAAIVAHRRAANNDRFKPVALYNLGCAYALTGKPDEAFEALEQAVQAGFGNAALFARDNDLVSLRDDPRFAALAGRLSPESAAAKAEIPLERAFDFWLGEWDVFDPEGTLAGTSRISSETGGRIIEENWVAANGATGKSISYVDTDGNWKQLWVDKDGEVIELTGRVLDDGLFFEGLHTYANGYTEQIRVQYTPLADGRVKQIIEQSKDEGESWYGWFDGTYVHKTPSASQITSAQKVPQVKP
jgi:tetratricopeptide (TPR) repeat protein